MYDRYEALEIIKVDRGMIPSSYKNGQAVLGQHIPYYAGTVIKNLRTENLEFLDEFNSEVLLKSIFGSIEHFDCDNFTGIINTKRDILNNRLKFVTVKDLNEYLKNNNVKITKRDAKRMQSISRRITLGYSL